MFRTVWLAAAAFAALATQVAAEQRIRVEVDKAQILRLEQSAATVVIGNPMIADATIHGDKMLVVTGRSYGTTNLIALDGNGEEILARTIDVQYASRALITVHKGSSRQSLTCAPVCETTLNVGDTAEYFEGLQKQIQTRVGMSGGSGAAKN